MFPPAGAQEVPPLSAGDPPLSTPASVSTPDISTKFPPETFEKKTKTKRKTNKPDGIQRHDPLSEEWISIFRKNELERAAKADKTKYQLT